MASETKRERFEKRWAALKSDRDPLLTEWRDLADNFWPRKIPQLETGGNGSSSSSREKRSRRNTKIINGTPRIAGRTLQHGMTAGLASAARPWFRLRSPDRELNEYAPVKQWLHDVQQILEDIFARSNFYNALGVSLGYQGIFGTLALGLFEDEIDDLRCQIYPIGGYCIAENSRGTVDTFYRSWFPTARQLVEQFGMRPGGTIDWSRISPEVKRAFEDKAQTEHRFEVVHVVEPNLDRDVRFGDARNMPVRSCYYEVGQQDKGILLRESGFNEMPVLGARWDVSGEDAYGTGPALDALGDAKALQYREKQKAKRIDKHNDPPLMGGPELKNKRVSLLNGDITYVGFSPNGNASLAPIHAVHHDTASLSQDIEQIERRIETLLFTDLFLMLSRSEQKDVTAEAIAKKYEEKVVILGPVIDRENGEILSPAIDRVFGIALRRGLLPPPPEELQDSPLKVEYVSLLAQAQRLVAASAIDRFTGLIGGLAKAQADAGEAPTVLDKLDFDQTADEYAEALGVPPTVVRSDEQVEQLREQRAQAAQAQATAAAAEPVSKVAKAAKDLSETQVQGRSVLDRMAENAGAQ